MRSTLFILSLAVIGACDDDRGAEASPDAGMQPEPDAGLDAGGEPDAAHDAGGEPDAAHDGGPMLTERATWVASQLRVPISAGTADELGFDLDGDGVIDNRLGRAYATLISQGGGSLDPQSIADDAVARGEAIILFEVLAEAFSPGAALEGRVLEGASPTPAPCSDENDLVCGRHLDGQGSFVAASPAPKAAAGSMTGTALSFGPGQARLPLFLGETPVWVSLERAQVTATLTAGILVQGKLGGAIPAGEVDATILPAVHADVAALVARDCPAMACEAGSAGAALLQLFDANEDGAVSLMEVRDNVTIQNLFAPDIDTDGDGAVDGLSTGLGFTTAGATFAAP